ncbi:MAG: hypothetical protein FWF52_00290, partial [Candidatus Azobacteroides sp.]|nr:hypothetical protein [Candidatus Azobacteroides sp.]
MADEGVRFSSGMQYNPDMQETARIMLDIDGLSEPQYMEIKDLKADLATKDELNAKLNLFNVTFSVPLSSGYYTPSKARLAVPIEMRKTGLILTYQTK